MIVSHRNPPANVKVTEDIAAASPTTNIAFALGPDDVKVEFVEDKSQKIPIQLHHIHFFGQMNTEMQAWYAKTFGELRQTWICVIGNYNGIGRNGESAKLLRSRAGVGGSNPRRPAWEAGISCRSCRATSCSDSQEKQNKRLRNL